MAYLFFLSHNLGHKISISTGFLVSCLKYCFPWQVLSRIFLLPWIAVLSQEHAHLYNSKRCFLLRFILDLVSDVDECRKIISGVISKGGCQHKCNNTIGSYSCSCNEGFALAYDRRTCLGMAKTFTFILAFLKKTDEPQNYKERRRSTLSFPPSLAVFHEPRLDSFNFCTEIPP